MKHLRIIAPAIGLPILLALSACGGDDVSAPAGTNPPAPGSLDASFGINGIVTTPIGTNSLAYALALQGDGKIVAAGYALIGGASNIALVRYTPDGAPDLSFDTEGIVTTPIANSLAYALALQGDGKIVVAGGIASNIALVRYTSDGAPDLSFDSEGIVTTAIGSTNSEAYALALQPDGKIVVAGRSFLGIASNIALVRYTADGAPDLSFDSDGIVTTAIGSTNSLASALALQPDGKIVVAGRSFLGTASNIALVRYTADGAPDLSFDSDGIVTTAIGSTNSLAYALALQPDGKIVVAGYAGIGTASNIALVRYTADGAPDLSFDTDGIVTTTIGSTNSRAAALALQGDGKIVAAGYALIGGATNIALVRYTPDGAPDLSFDTDGIVTTPIASSEAYALALQGDGKIVVAGNSFFAGVFYIVLVRYNR